MTDDAEVDKQGVTLGPKEMVLDLLRAYSLAPLSVGVFIKAGEAFGFSDNQIRVTLNRLSAKKRIYAPERGKYALVEKSPGFMQGWREGAARKKLWEGEWLAVCLPSLESRRIMARSRQVLELWGFREGLSKDFYVRPDNLINSRRDQQELMEARGLAAVACIFKCEAEADRLRQRWSNLWQAENWPQRHRAMIGKLKKSMSCIPAYRLVEQLNETFSLGGQSIALLLRDPLLPDELADNTAWLEHTEMMQRYDKVGRSLWVEIIEG